MSFIKQFISEQIATDPTFKEAYKKAKLEEKIALDLIQLRKEAKLTQADLAKKLNTRQSAISRIENADINLTLLNLIKHAEALGVDVEITFKKKQEVISN
jgi:HTH-type transcriptional regulator / antitoxin HipB